MTFIAYTFLLSHLLFLLISPPIQPNKKEYSLFSFLRHDSHIFLRTHDSHLVPCTLGFRDGYSLLILSRTRTIFFGLWSRTLDAFDQLVFSLLFTSRLGSLGNEIEMIYFLKIIGCEKALVGWAVHQSHCALLYFVIYI